MHLLQPIKDLATNWNINIAEDLDEFLVRQRCGHAHNGIHILHNTQEELEHLTFAFEDGPSLNFAEGAWPATVNTAYTLCCTQRRCSSKVLHACTAKRSSICTASSFAPSSFSTKNGAGGQPSDVYALDVHTGSNNSKKMAANDRVSKQLQTQLCWTTTASSTLIPSSKVHFVPVPM